MPSSQSDHIQSKELNETDKLTISFDKQKIREQYIHIVIFYSEYIRWQWNGWKWSAGM